MTRNEFNAIIEDIEERMQGEGYFVVKTVAGHSFEGGWNWLVQNTPLHEIVVIDANNCVPAYVPLSSIESIQVSAR